MKNITDRCEFGSEVNFGKNPVVYIDATNKDEYGIKGTLVRVDMGKFSSGRKFLEGCEVRFYKTEYKTVTYSTSISPRVSCLSAQFGYSDVIEDAKYATAPIIATGDKVVFVIDNPMKKRAAVAVCTMGRTIKFCQNAIKFADKDGEELSKLVFQVAE